MKYIFAILVALAAGCNGKGIVVIEDYAHGVAFCEKEFNHVVHHKDATTWSDGVATFVVNRGHENDKEIKQLVELAETICSQYN